jgi:two-component system CitB family sensor kinase
MRKRLRRSSASHLLVVLGNLIQNGMDGALSVPEAKTAWVQVEIRPAGRAFKLVVPDWGPRVHSTMVSEVFEHGFTTKAARHGERGIGLALSRLICRRRGGEVEVDGTQQGAELGARMTVTPAASKRPPGTSAPATSAGGSSR